MVASDAVEPGAVTARKRVLVTRAPHQASELAERLRELGAEPVLIPAIELAEPESLETLDVALRDLGTFHWIIFTSANAVEAFARRRGVHGLANGQMLPGLPAEVRIAAIGPATVRAVESHGMKAALVPARAVAESLTEALLPHARQPDGSPTRFLLVRAAEARETLPEALQAAGGEVVIAPAYRNVVPAASLDLVRRMASDQSLQIDAITFTSSSSVRNLLSLFEAAGLQLPQGALRISIGPITTRTLTEVGLPPHAEAPEASVAALAETVMRALSARTSG